MAPPGIPLLKFVGTVSLGLLTGVSYSISAFALPNILNLPSSSSASHALTTLTASLKTRLVALSTLAAAPLLLAFALSPRTARHPYLLYTSLIAVLSAVAPDVLFRTTPRPIAPVTTTKKASRPARSMEASYEVLGDAPSEATSDEETEEINGEDVRTEVEVIKRGFTVRGGLAALGFFMATIGIWGDGTPQAVVYVA
jgi:autophagy-related protein 33